MNTGKLWEILAIMAATVSSYQRDVIRFWNPGPFLDRPAAVMAYPFLMVSVVIAD